MKKPATPQKNITPGCPHNLPKFIDIPRWYGQENEFRERLRNKNTLQAARIIAEEFVERFGEAAGNANDIVTRLLPDSRRAISWEDLSFNIDLFCKQFYSYPDTTLEFVDKDAPAFPYIDDFNYSMLEFLNRVEDIIFYLPKRKGYKLSEDRENYKNPSDIARHFSTCYLCWRSVPRKPLEKTTPLCHVHDILYSDDIKYRRRKRMLVNMYKIRNELLEYIPTPVWIRQNTKYNQNDYFMEMCIDINGPLPNVAQYLLSKNMPLDNHRNVLCALEHPAYCYEKSEEIRAAWRAYFDDFGTYFWMNYIKILNAEAWLRAEKEYKCRSRTKEK